VSFNPTYEERETDAAAPEVSDESMSFGIGRGLTRSESSLNRSGLVRRGTFGKIKKALQVTSTRDTQQKRMSFGIGHGRTRADSSIN
jgi:hypothetical protein